MGKARSAAIAVLIGSMILAGGTPAFAADALGVVSTGLTDGQLVGAKQVIHPVLAGDVTGIDLLVDGVVEHSWTTVPAALVLTFSTIKTWTDADVTVRVHDASGGTAEATTHVSVDATPPVATFAPAAGATAHGDSVTITAPTVSDDVAEIAVLKPTGEVVASTTTAPWSITWPLVDHQYGFLHLFLEVVDKAGNIRTYDLDYYVDNLGPSISMDWRYSDVAGVVPGGVNYVSADVHDQAGVDRIEWWLGGVQVGTGDQLRYDFGTTSRTVTGEIRAWDKLGNASTWPISIDVDASGPVVRSITPASGALVRGSRIYSTLQATDRSGFRFAALSDGLATDFTAPFTGSIPAGKDGAHVLTWYVYDTYYYLTVARRTVIVDNTKPALKVTKAPKNKAKVKGTVKVKVSATDRNGINRVELLINGKVVAKDVKAGYAFSINTKKYGKKFTVKLRAYDRAGNATTTSTRTWHR